jgi:cysteine-rich repeat protein
MKHTSPETACASRAHRVAASPWRLAVVLLCATGCLESGLVLCANGLACPVTERCDEIHRTCVLPEQLSVCVGIADGTDCTSGPVSGACFDSVCLPRGCGNTVVEPIEMCDDGNQIAGDGCSGDCRSTERCGNGFIDPGEPCDDGDLVSRDGCDSRCQIEASVWSDIIAIAPSSLDGRYGAYDVARERFVYTRWEGTWEWDGARWTFTPPPSISDIFVEAVFYDPDRQQVSMIGSDQLGAAHLYVWVDAAWRRVDRGDGPMLVGFPPRIAATYDAARHRVMMIDTAQSTTWMIDATGAWSQLANVPGALTESVAAFDPASSHVVLETIESVEWVYDGSDWTSALTDFGPNVSLAFSPDRGRLVLVDNTTWTMHERLGATWTLVVGDELPCHNRRAFEAVPLYHDHGKSALTALSRDATQDCSWIPWASAWNVRSLAVPFHPIGATYDSTTRSFAVLHNANPEDPDSPTEAWLRSGDGWQRVDAATTPGGRQPSLAVYAPGRAATVLYGERASTQPVDAPHPRRARAIPGASTDRAGPSSAGCRPRCRRAAGPPRPTIRCAAASC